MISHPVANCQDAWDKYKEWAQFKKGSKEYAYAAEKYRYHLKKCLVCREALDETN